MSVPVKSQFSVKRHWHKPSDFSFHKTFGTAATFAPSMNMVTRILDQGGLNACTAFTAVAIREWMKAPTQFDPVAQWNEELVVWGTPDADGVDLQTQMATGVLKGFLPVGATTPTDNTAAYFTVTPTISVFTPSGLDRYDSMKSAMTLQNCPLSVGVVWYQEWVGASGGIIPHTQISVLGRHDVKCAGWTTIDGTEYLIIQNSWGVENGNNGLYYFDRYTANLAFNQGTFFWTDSLVPNYKKTGLLMALCQNLIDLLTQLSPGVAQAFGLI